MSDVIGYTPHLFNVTVQWNELSNLAAHPVSTATLWTYNILMQPQSFFADLEARFHFKTWLLPLWHLNQIHIKNYLCRNMFVHNFWAHCFCPLVVYSLCRSSPPVSSSTHSAPAAVYQVKGKSYLRPKSVFFFRRLNYYWGNFFSIHPCGWLNDFIYQLVLNLKQTGKQ